MGAKYLPTVKDQKASLRFQRLQADKLKAAKAKRVAGSPPPQGNRSDSPGPVKD